MHQPSAQHTAKFRKSSHSSASDNCVEVADWQTGSAIRDTQHREHGALSFPAAEWRAFITSAKDSAL
nr:DUF397 domain-containing protein [Nocardiopsis ansamitocini]